MKRYNTSGNVADISTVYGYSAAQTMVAVLRQCGDNLTRDNVMKQAASIHELKLPMLLPGITMIPDVGFRGTAEVLKHHTDYVRSVVSACKLSP